MINFANMLQKCDILLFGTMGDIGRTLEADLSGHGLTVISVPFPQNTFRDFSGYRRELLKVLESFHPAMIMPVGDALALAMLRPEIPSEIAIPVDSPETIGLLSSKCRTYELARSLGIRQPELCSAADLAAGRRVIFKRDVSFGGSGVHKPRTLAALDNLIAHENGTPFLIEEFIDGQDISVDCIRCGEFFQAGCYVSLGREYTQGPSVERRSVECPEAVAVAAALLGHLDFHGVCGLDFRLGRFFDASPAENSRLAENDRLYFLECNPRFTGGLATQLASGFDLPYLLYDKFA